MATVLADDVQSELTKRLTLRDPQGRARLIRRWVREAATGFDHAPLRAFVPILVERAVRSRLLASPTTPDDSAPEPIGPNAPTSLATTVMRHRVHDTGTPLSPTSQTELTRRLTARHAPRDPAHRQVIGQLVHETAARFDHAPCRAFVPILVEHAVHERLLAESAPS